MHRVFRAAAVAVTLAVSVTACAEAPLPTAAPEDAQLQRTPAARPGSATIVETALAVNAATGEFSTLIAALQAAGLVDALNGGGQYTVFAPTDAAFAALPAGTIEALLGDIPTLQNILLYHVTEGRRQSQSVVNARQITMLNGSKAPIQRVGGHVYIDGAKIVTTDISASNGIIHVIDAVILP